MSNYDSNRHKRGDKVKWFFTGLAFFLVIVTIVGMCLQLWGNGKVKPSEWFKQEETEENTPDTPEASENGGATLSEGESNGMLLSATAIPLSSYEEYGVSALAENAYMLSVTYTPEDTTFQETTYTMAFKDGTDCSACATLTQTGSKTATFSVLQPFSTQIIITATCNRNTAIKATTTVDYVGTFNLGLINFESIDMENDNFTVTSNNVTPYINGTLCPDYTESIVTIVFDVRAFAELCAGTNTELDDYVTYTANFSSAEEFGDDLLDLTIESILRKAGHVENLTYSSAEYKTWWSVLSSNVLDGNTPDDWEGAKQLSAKVISHRIYNGVDYGNVVVYEGSIALYGWGIFEVSATAMSSDIPSIIAG